MDDASRPMHAWLALALALGAALALLIPDSSIDALARSLEGERPAAFWLLARASGITAYALAWLSIVAGLLMSTGALREIVRGPTLLELHRQASYAAVGLAAFHALVLLGDRFVSPSIGAILVPFAMDGPLRAWVALGQIAFYASVLIAVSFRARDRIGPRAWRALHYASFGVYAIVLAHAIAAGTDASSPVALVFYASTAAVVVVLTALRLAKAR